MTGAERAAERQAFAQAIAEQRAIDKRLALSAQIAQQNGNAFRRVFGGVQRVEPEAEVLWQTNPAPGPDSPRTKTPVALPTSLGPIHACPWHTKAVFDPASLPAIVDWAVKIVREINADAIAATGHSGLVAAGAISYITKIPVFAVRKHGEPTVAGSGPVSAIAPNGPAQRWVWFDDFIGSGGTFQNARDRLWDELVLASPVPAAILQYGRDTNEPHSWDTDNFRLGYKALRWKGIPLPPTIPNYTFKVAAKRG